MIVSNSKKFIFVHVHKCAGSTIANLLSQYTRWNDIELGVTSYGEATQSLYRERFGLWKHSRAIDIRGVVGGEVFDAYFKFGFVRNPFYRIISFYTFIQRLLESSSAETRRHVQQWPTAIAASETRTFSEFIRHPQLREPPMFRMLTEAPKRPRHLLVDFVGKVETFDRDIRRVFDRLALPIPEKIEKANVSRKTAQPLNRYYATESDLEFVYNKYARDFEVFDYSIEEGLAAFRLGK